MIQIIEMTDAVIAENERKRQNREEMLNNPLACIALGNLGLFIPGTIDEEVVSRLLRGQQ